jgi:acyl-coenzyme A thioesterase PaaI-like protein
MRCPDAVDRCVVCGPKHPGGLRVKFRRAGTRVTATFVPRRAHQGFHGLMSGGLLAAIFDCLTYRVVLLEGVVAAVTARIEVDYRRPIPLGRRVTFEASLERRRGRVFEIRASARLGEDVAGEARTVYVEIPAERLPVRRAT